MNPNVVFNRKRISERKEQNVEKRQTKISKETDKFDMLHLLHGYLMKPLTLGKVIKQRLH